MDTKDNSRSRAAWTIILQVLRGIAQEQHPNQSKSSVGISSLGASDVRSFGENRGRSRSSEAREGEAVALSMKS